jgi:hypothetical protein
MLIHQAHAYIRSLRNPSKRAYAEQYWNWLIDQLVTESEKPQPEHSCLSARAAQAVRMRLREFFTEPYDRDGYGHGSDGW